MIGLTDEEIAEIAHSVPFGSTYSAGGDEVAFSWNKVRELNRAQLKKVMKWGIKSCPHENNKLFRRECPKCWQVLLEEIE